MTTHELKTVPEPFEWVWNGRKTFEIRQDDRDFRVGDMLTLKEWCEVNGYSGRVVSVHVTYIARDAWGLPPGLVVMGWSHRYCIEGFERAARPTPAPAGGKGGAK